MSAQLKPCPFCGAKLEYRAPRSSLQNYYEHPKGNDCFLASAGGLGDSISVLDDPKAIAEWNQRQPPLPVQEPVAIPDDVRTAAQNDTLLQAREVAAAYREQNSQVDSGNLYWALMKCLEFVDARSVQPEQGSLEGLRQMLQIEVDRLIAAKVQH